MRPNMRKRWAFFLGWMLVQSCSEPGSTIKKETVEVSGRTYTDSLISRLNWDGSSGNQGLAIQNSYYRIQEFSSGKQGLLKVTESMKDGKAKPIKTVHLKTYALENRKMDLLSEIKFEASEWEFHRSVVQAQISGKDTEEDAIDLYNLENGNHLLHCAYSYLKVMYSNSRMQQFWGFNSRASAQKGEEFQDPTLAGILDFGSTEQHLGSWALYFKDQGIATNFPLYSPEFYFESEGSNLTRTDENRGLIVSGSDEKAQTHPKYWLVMVFYDQKGNANTCKIPVTNGKPDFEQAVYDRGKFHWQEFHS